MIEKSQHWTAVGILLVGAVLSLALPSFADSNLSTLGVSTSSSDDIDSEAVVEEESDGNASTQSADTAAASGALSKLSVHGFLTQAWADAKFVEVPTQTQPDGTVVPLGPSPSLFEEALGIPEDGTTNYRFLALQFRYDISQRDVFVVQLSSRTLGFSSLQQFEDEIELDWAFYERRLADNTSVKIGRVQIPFGIFNEIRDVGTILPFYRPSILVYKEASFTSETVDGLSLSHTFFADKDWNLDVSLYAGEWDSIQVVPQSPDLSSVIRASNGYGYQIWLNTPFSGVRLGTSLISFRQQGGPFAVLDRRDIYLGSLDAPLGRFTLQAEWSVEEDITFPTPIGNRSVSPSEWYVQAGFRATDKLGIWGLWDVSEISIDCPCFLGGAFGRTQRETKGMSLNYQFSPALVLKLEHHLTAEEGFTSTPDFSTGAFLLRNDVFEAKDGHYTILSLSVSF